VCHCYNPDDVHSVQLTDRPDVVAISTLRNFLESCMFDISQSDNVTVDEAVRTFDVSVEVVSIYSVRIMLIINQVVAVSCPGVLAACSGQGSCDAALCVCDTGIIPPVTTPCLR